MADQIEVQNLERSLRVLVCLSFSAAQGVRRTTGDDSLAKSWWQTAMDALEALEHGKLFKTANLLRRLESIADAHTVRPRIEEIRRRVDAVARRRRPHLEPIAAVLSLE